MEWDLGGNKKAMVREFKGKWYVDIREVYMDKTGEMKPGKKGMKVLLSLFIIFFVSSTFDKITFFFQ